MPDDPPIYQCPFCPRTYGLKTLRALNHHLASQEFVPLRTRILVLAKVIMRAEGDKFVDPVPDIENAARSKSASFGFNSPYWAKYARSRRGARMVGRSRSRALQPQATSKGI